MADTSRTGRRRFLGTSLGATAAVLAGTRLAPAAALGAADRIRVGVIGTGGRARGLMRQLKELPGQEIMSGVSVSRNIRSAASSRVSGQSTPADPA